VYGLYYSQKPGPPTSTIAAGHLEIGCSCTCAPVLPQALATVAYSPCLRLPLFLQAIPRGPYSV